MGSPRDITSDLVSASVQEEGRAQEQACPLCGGTGYVKTVVAEYENGDKIEVDETCDCRMGARCDQEKILAPYCMGGH
jgi:hypothetical protein